jgi:hypothetical protein
MKEGALRSVSSFISSLIASPTSSRHSSILAARDLLNRVRAAAAHP